MIEIEIRPACGVHGGLYRSVGHAEKGMEKVCTAVTAIADCLGANLDNTWNIKATRKAEKGLVELRWHKTDRKGQGLPRANLAAGFAYTGLKELAVKYPGSVLVIWRQNHMERREEHETK